MNIGSQIRRIAILNVPVEAMREMFLVLAEQLEQEESKRRATAERQRLYRLRHSNGDNGVTVTQQSHNNDVIVALLAPVVDNTLTSLTTEKKEESKNPPIVPPSKPLSAEPEGFSVFMEKYPKREGNANRKGAAKAYAAALKRTKPQTLWDGADAYRAFCEATGTIKTQYVQQPRTWLNADGWTETYERNPNGKAPKLSSIDRAEAELLADIDEHWRRKDEAEASDIHGDNLAPNVSRLRQVN